MKLRDIPRKLFAVAALYGKNHEGDLMYNSTYNVMQYCNGTNWVRIGSHAP